MLFTNYVQYMKYFIGIAEILYERLSFIPDL
jgi:hypothetical protein